MRDDGGITTTCSTNPAATLARNTFKAELVELIDIVWRRLGLRLIPCPLLTVHVRRFNEHIKVQLGDDAASQKCLDDTIIRINGIIQRVNKDRNIVTPRFDRNLFHYEPRTKRWFVYYRLLQIAGIIPCKSLRDIICTKMCKAISTNDMVSHM